MHQQCTAVVRPKERKIKHFAPLYNLISMRQFHIFSIKPKLDMQLKVDFYVFTRFWLNLSDQNVKLFWTSKQNNFRFQSSKFSQKRVKTQKTTNNHMSSFGLIEKYRAVSYYFSCINNSMERSYYGIWTFSKTKN